MSVILVGLEDTFDQWRSKTNNISIGIGNIPYLKSGDSTVVKSINRNYSNIGTLSALTTTLNENLVDALNEIDYHTDINTISIGTLSSLTTSDKSSIVNSINEVGGKVGTLSSLTTDAKSNLVSAINETDAHTDTNTVNIGTITNLPGYGVDDDCVSNIVNNANDITDIETTLGITGNYPYGIIIEDNLVDLKSDIDTINATIGSSTLSTTATTIIDAVNEVYSTASTIGDLTLLETEEQGNIVGSINEVNNITAVTNTNTGDLLTLETGDKSSIVAAINEVAMNTIVMALILG